MTQHRHPDSASPAPPRLMLAEDAARELKAHARDLPSWDLTPRQFADLELLMNGAFAPLTGFMTRVEYEGVVRDLRLPDGALWPMPITLEVTEKFAETLQHGRLLALRDAEGVMLAVIEIADLWLPDRGFEAALVYGTEDTSHPGVARLLGGHPVYVGGRVLGIESPTHYDFSELRLAPGDTRGLFHRLGWRRVVGFHTEAPLHRAEVELTLRAARRAEANLHIQPVGGIGDAGALDRYTTVRCAEQALRHYPAGSAQLSILPLHARHAGPREALLHALIHRNFGCTHCIVRPHQGSPADPALAARCYPAEAAAEMALRHEQELGIAVLPMEDMRYVEERAEYVPVSELAPEDKPATFSPADLARRLRDGREVPGWFSYPEVIAELARATPSRHRRGVTIFFTGLSGAGKSSIANALLVKLMETGRRSVTLLDGDIVRKNLSSELGFSREHRDLNILRIGFVASEITKHGGIAICAPIAPYAATRRKVRDIVGAHGEFIEVYVATPIEVCEQRDRKGLYAKARAGLIKEFTGVSDPYEAPGAPEILIDTRECTPLEGAQQILNRLEMDGFIGGDMP